MHFQDISGVSLHKYTWNPSTDLDFKNLGIGYLIMAIVIPPIKSLKAYLKYFQELSE